VSTFKKAILQLHIFVFLAGLTGPLGYLIQLNGLFLVFYRMLIASIILVGLYLFRKNKPYYSTKTKMKLFGIGAIIAMHWVCFYASIKLANVSIALVCFSSTSLFSSILEPLARKLKIQVQDILIGLLCLVGLLLIFHFDSKFRSGIIVGLFSAFFAAVFSIINKQITNQVDVNTIQTFEMTGGFLFLIPCVFISSAMNHFDPILAIPSYMDWGWLFILAIGCTVISNHLMLSALKHISAFTLNVSLNLEPVYGILLAFIFFKEQKQLGSSFYIGLLFILFSVVVQMFRVIKQHRLKRTQDHKIQSP